MEDQSNPHHLILGELTDFLTGDVLTDTLDERYRQKIAKLLVSVGGFDKTEVLSNIRLEVGAGQKKAIVKIDFLVRYQEKIMALVKFAPGSLVTRRLSTLALSRLIKPYQVPIVVITNGEDAEILDGTSGKVMATGMQNLPDKETIKKKRASSLFGPIKKKTIDQASKIAYACEVDGACPCDTDVCLVDE